LPAIRFSLLGFLLCGGLYSAGVTQLNQWLFPAEASGSLLTVAGQPVGSLLVAQPFSAPQYLHGRPSAVGTDPMATGGSNLAPDNPQLRERVAGESARLQSLYQVDADALPVDLLAASGSGVDPDISPAAAELQLSRLATVRGCALASIQQLLAQQVTGPQWGLLGEPRVNVLRFNLALDSVCPFSAVN
jgi:K+-transporting ATPase ATPase C chain